MLYTLKWRKVYWIGHILRRNCLLKQLLKRRCKESEDEKEDVGSYWMTLREVSVQGIERGSTRCHSGENPLWNWLWTCRKIDSTLIGFRSKSFSDSWLINFRIIHWNVMWVAGIEVNEPTINEKMLFWWSDMAILQSVVVSVCTTFCNVKKLRILPT